MGPARAHPLRRIAGVPVDPHTARVAPDEPADEIVREIGPDRGARDASDLGLVERREVGAQAFQPLDPPREAREQPLRPGEHSGVLRVGAQEEKGFVEADQALRVRRIAAREEGQRLLHRPARGRFAFEGLEGLEQASRPAGHGPGCYSDSPAPPPT
ncbi:MAG: hypothetical protein ACRD1P_05455 [Thermoanaerobaculia bacterium]